VLAKPESLPLREALLAFSDPVLAERWREAKQEALPPLIHLPYPTYDPVLKDYVPGELAKLDPAYIERAKAQNALRSALQDAERKARTVLERDFRNRVASGEVVLEGLQFAPNLAAARSTIPSVWARLLIFQLADSIWVGNQKIKFMEVTACRPVSLVSAPTASVAPVGTAVGVDTGPSPRPRGRENFSPLIKAVLRAHWAEVRQRGL
jgi:hypothetical protein